MINGLWLQVTGICHRIMNSSLFVWIFVVGVSTLSNTPAAAAPREYRVALRPLAGSTRYVTAKGTDLHSKKDMVTPSSIFILTDLDGGELEQGDEVRISIEGRNWRALDKGGQSVIVSPDMRDSATIFVFVGSWSRARFQSESGHFISASRDGANLGARATNKDNDEAQFELISDPRAGTAPRPKTIPPPQKPNSPTTQKPVSTMKTFCRAECSCGWKGTKFSGTTAVKEATDDAFRHRGTDSNHSTITRLISE
jgi:hypothetical protein